MKRAGILLAVLACLSMTGAAGAQVIGAQTTNASVTIATGGAFQQVITAGLRRSLTIQNNNSSDTCWVFIGSGTASAAKSLALSAGTAYTRYYPYIPSDTIQATCTTTGDTLYVDYQ
jgi:hypothetical protein